MRHQLDRLLDLLHVALELGLVAGVREILRLGIDALGELDVLRDVDHHRAGPAAGGDVERLVQHARQILDALHQVIVLGARPRDADRVAFLERVVADQVRRHLAGDADDRDRIHQRIGQAGDRIGGAGTGGDQHAADLAGRARIAFRGVHRALLVAHQDVLHFVLLEERVVDRQHRAARIAEQVLHALVGERLDHHFGAGHFPCHGRHPSTSSPIVVSFYLAHDLFRRPVPTFRDHAPAIKKAREGPCPDAHLASPCQGCPGCVRTCTSTVIILRIVVSARTFIARFYSGAPGPGQASFVPAILQISRPKAEFRELFAPLPAPPRANPSSDCETR